MKFRLGYLITLLFFFSCSNEPAPESEAGKMLQGAARYLWSQQAKDGGWHSQTHGILKSGQTCSPFVLDALLTIPDSIHRIDPEQKAKALKFIQGQINPDGAVGLMDPDLLEYPNYSTAFTLKVLALHGGPDCEEPVARMRNYLLHQQFDESRGYGPEHAVYGGWGFGESFLMPGNPGHVDLSHTRRILEALKISGGLSEARKAKARIFLDRMQQHPDALPCKQGWLAELADFHYDGGFFYSPIQEDLNKGGLSKSGSSHHVVAYATSTADGFLALVSLGEPGPRQRDAADWLLAHHRWDYPEGIPKDHLQAWHRVMTFYHLTVRAQAYGIFKQDKAWAAEMVAFLKPQQGPQGSFYNPNGAANKENDPLLATAMVVRALVAGLE